MSLLQSQSRSVNEPLAYKCSRPCISLSVVFLTFALPSVERVPLTRGMFQKWTDFLLLLVGKYPQVLSLKVFTCTHFTDPLQIH